MLELIIGILTIIFLIYKWLTWNFQYWKNQNIPYLEPSLFFGNLKEIFLGRKCLADGYDELYKHYPGEPAIGIFNLRYPQLIIKDPKFYKILAINEFASFRDNTIRVDEKIDPIAACNPFVTAGERWKLVRTINIRNLTLNRIKAMIPLIVNVSLDMIEFVQRNLGKPLEAKYFAGQFTTDVTSSCGFGVESNSFKDPNLVFRKKTENLFHPSIRNNFIFTVLNFVPRLNKIMRMRFFSDDSTNFYEEVIRKSCKYREENNFQRNDFLQIFVNERKAGKKDCNYEEIVGYLITFIINGFETSSVLLSHILYQLAIHPAIQHKLKNEIRENVKNFEEISLEQVETLKYLGAVFNEAARLFPSASVLVKQCTKDIKIDYLDRSYSFKKGTACVIPLYSIQRDSRFYDNPLEFKPERFLRPENSDEVPEIFTFGIGPRACIGQRFAITQLKIALTALLLNFIIEPVEIVEKIDWDPLASIFIIPKIPLKIIFRKC